MGSPAANRGPGGWDAWTGAVAALLIALLLPAHDASAQRVQPKPRSQGAWLDPVPREMRRDPHRPHGAMPLPPAIEAAVARAAPARHRWLETASRDEALRRIDAMSDAELGAHLFGLDPIDLRRLDPGSLALRDASAAPAEWQRQRRAASASLRARYRAYIAREAEAHTHRMLAALSPAEQADLLAFARGEGRPAGDVGAVPLAIADRWLGQVLARDAEIAAQFPLADPARAGKARMRSLSGLAGMAELHPDGHENTYMQRALRDHIRNDAFLSRMGADRWRYRIGEDADGARIWRLLRMLRAPVPGREPQIVYFLDRTLAASPIERMDAAWTRPGRRTPRTLEHADIEAFLAQFAGQTLILIGHIEQRHFVQDRADGRPALRMEVPALLEAATRHRVLLVPLGCNSASAGAHVGFTRAIGTDEVAALLGAIPPGRIAVGELLSAFNAIDGRAVSIDAARLDAFLEVTVHRQRDSAGKGVVDDTATVLRIPAPTAPQGRSAPDDFATYLASWESAHRPVLDRGILRAWRAVYRDAPIRTLFLSGAAWLLLLVSWERLRARWLLRERLIGRRERTAMRIGHALGGLLVLGALLRWAAAMWPILVFVLVAAVIFGMLSASFGDGETTT